MAAIAMMVAPMGRSYKILSTLWERLQSRQGRALLLMFNCAAGFTNDQFGLH